MNDRMQTVSSSKNHGSNCTLRQFGPDFTVLLTALAEFRLFTEPVSTLRQSAESPFLRLPAEIRHSIYSEALVSGPPNLALLQTCMQVNMEAREHLYRRTAKMSSQKALFDWIEQSQPLNLKRLRTLELTLIDIDLSMLLNARDRHSSRQSAWAMYQQDLHKLDQAFSQMTNLTRIHLHPPWSTHSHLLKGLYISCLKLIPHRCPNLETLVVHDSAEVAGSVPALKQLLHLTFTTPSIVTQDMVEREIDRPPKRDVVTASVTPRKSKRGTPHTRRRLDISASGSQKSTLRARSTMGSVQ